MPGDAIVAKPNDDTISLVEDNEGKENSAPKEFDQNKLTMTRCLEE